MDGFEELYKIYYKVVREVTIDKSRIAAGTSSFYDSKACSKCEEQKRRACEAKEVLKINHNRQIFKVELEKFFNQFDGLTLSSLKDKCDLMLYDQDNEHLVFCELTCTQSKYIEPYDNTKGHHEGKRAKAYKQLKSSIGKLAAVPKIAARMNEYNHRSALFAVRQKEDTEQEDSLELTNIRRFSALTDSIQQEAKSDIGNGFTFEIVKYPNIYHWDIKVKGNL